MRKVITSLQAEQMEFNNEPGGGESLTIPGQSISAAELLRRYATGQPLGFKNVTPVYDDDEGYDVPELYKMNQLDRLHYLQASSERVAEARQRMEQYLNEQRFKNDSAKDQNTPTNSNEKKPNNNEQKSGSERSDSERNSE